MLKKVLFIALTLYVLKNNAFSQVTVQMQSKNGIYSVPCKINGLILDFYFDTGASNVVLSLTEALFMLKNGYLNKYDIIGTSYSQVATGSITENTRIRLREIEIAGIKVYDVEAIIMHNTSAPLLFGQSAIQKLGKIQLDGNKLSIFQNKTSNNLVYEFAKDGIRAFYKGIEEYKQNHFENALALFNAYTANKPDSVYGYYWAALAQSNLDQDMKYGYAIPNFIRVLAIADDDKSKLKSQGIQAAGYIAAYYNNVKNDKSTAIYYLRKGLEFDPTNQGLQNSLDVLLK